MDFPSHRLTVQRSPTSAAAATFSEWSAAIFFKRTVCSAQIKYLIWDFTGCGIFSGLWTQNQRFNPTRWVDFFCKEHDEIFTTVLYWMYATGFEQKIADAIHRLIDILKNRY